MTDFSQAPCWYENAYTSAVEVFAMQGGPSRVFCYPQDGKATTWMGDAISRGPIRFGRTYRDNFGGRRQSVSFVGIGGHRYSGTLFETYIRAKRCKA